MERQTVRSSNIRSVGYDPQAAVLEIESQSGTIYQYPGVPADTYAKFMQAGSKGRYFSAHVKKRFRFRQVR